MTLSPHAQSLLDSQGFDDEDRETVLKKAAAVAKHRGNERILEADMKTAIWLTDNPGKRLGRIS